jgi:CBS domain-containing protein
MQIEGITLWLFGGVAKFRGMFPSAGAEFRIAIAGPLVSLAIGGFFVLAAWRLALPDAVDGVAAWLGYINLVLLVFNMLPALPLDGGRVLRAALWQARGSFDWATVVAANVGRAFGVLMIVGGIVLVLFRDAVSGIWLAFIGVFLWQAAGAELRFLVAREALGGLRVRDLMIRDPVTVGPELTVRQLMDVLAREGEHETYPVVRAGHLVGLLPLARIAQVPRSEWETATVGDCALSLDHVPLLRADDELIDALQEVGTADMQRGLVVEDGDRLVGLVSIEDLVRAVQTGIVRRGIRVRR